jgi:hypothetical protein
MDSSRIPGIDSLILIIISKILIEMKFQLLLPCLLFLNWVNGYTQQNKIVFELESETAIDTTRFELWLWPKMDVILFTPKYERYRFSKQSSGIYSLTIVTDEPKVMSDFSKLPFPNRLPALLSPGDSVRITKTNSSYTFSGRGSHAFDYLYKANSMLGADFNKLSLAMYGIPTSKEAYRQRGSHRSGSDRPEPPELRGGRNCPHDHRGRDGRLQR